MYKTATSPYPAGAFTELDFGWNLSEDKEFLDLHWFEGDQVPPALEAIENNEEVSDDEMIENDSEDSDIEDEDFEL